MRNGGEPKVAVIGLDCAEPRLVFERSRGRFPNLEQLMDVAPAVLGLFRLKLPPDLQGSPSPSRVLSDPTRTGTRGANPALPAHHED
jgi:hypothetical protein